jgi:hypothetical protein
LDGRTQGHVYQFAMVGRRQLLDAQAGSELAE